MKSIFLELCAYMLVMHFCNGDTKIDGNLFGPGVCSRHNIVTKTVRVTQMDLADETTWEFCWDFPPWCTVYLRTIYNFVQTNQDIPLGHLKLSCCKDWKMNLNKTACLPVCSSLCLTGFCVDVNNCSRCSSGYNGEKCEELSEPLPNIICSCPNDNFVCDHEGHCKCTQRFKGPNCTDIVEAKKLIVGPAIIGSCSYYTTQVVLALWLLLASLCVIIYFIKKRLNIDRFQLLDDSLAESSTSPENTI